MAFPQEEYLTDETGREFLPRRRILPLRRMRTPGGCRGFTYFIRTMSDAAGIYAMPAMQSNALRADFT